ncbi:MAG: hypothetical protein GY927_02285, partial [bacterium]|nr:hypothetical protein [bacterium]
MNKPLVGFIVKWLLTLALLIGCIHLLDLKKIEHAIASIDFYAFVTAVTLALVGTIILPAIVTHKALFKNQIRINQLELIVINLCMRFYTLVLPRVLSVTIRWKRYRAKGEAANVTALMVFERLVQILVYCLAALLFLALDHHHTDITRTSLWSLLGLVLTTLTVLAIFLARGKGATTDNSWLETTGWLRQIIQRLWEAARAYRDLSHTELLYILSLSILTYLL